MDTFADVLTARVHQSLCDLALETGPMLRAPAEHLSSCKAVLKRAHSLNSPSVQHYKVSLVLSSWEIKAALAEIGMALCGYLVFLMHTNTYNTTNHRNLKNQSKGEK